MKIAIAGLGTVGGGLVELLANNAAEILARCGEKIEVVGISARKKRDGHKWYDNPLELVKTDAEIIVELIGGENGVALELVKAALSGKKHVITANKAMLAHHGGELAELAEKNGVQLRYEAAVAGGIPVIKALREGLAGNKINRISGILNGTCNYILTEMEAQRKEFNDVLHEAQSKGYAEANPAFDIGGIDAAHKLAILAANAFGKKPNFKELYVEGIDKIKLADIDLAKKLGYRIKHLCFAAQQINDEGQGGHRGAIEQRAHPCLLSVNHPLANIDGVFNAVEIEAEPVGMVVLHGRGAGAGPTASAVVADIVDIILKRSIPTFTIPAAKLGALHALKISEISSAYYLRLSAEDKPGVLEEITHVFKEAQISIHKFFQDEVKDGVAQIAIITHAAQEKVFNEAVAKLGKLDSLKERPQVVRIVE